MNNSFKQSIPKKTHVFRLLFFYGVLKGFQTENSIHRLRKKPT